MYVSHSPGQHKHYRDIWVGMHSHSKSSGINTHDLNNRAAIIVTAFEVNPHMVP